MRRIMSKQRINAKAVGGPSLQVFQSIRKLVSGSDPARLVTRYGAIAAVIAVLSSLVLAPLVTSMITDWSRRDVELRSTLVFNSVQEPLASMLANQETSRIQSLFERVSADARVMAVAFCRGDGVPEIASKLMPASLTCEKIARADTESFSSVKVNGRDTLIGSFPISTREASGHFVIVHDLSFADRRGAEARRYVSLLLGGIVLLSGALAIGLVIVLIRRWTQSFRRAVTSATSADASTEKSSGFSVLDREMRQVLRQLRIGRESVDAEQVNWTKDTLRQIMSSDLPGVEVLVVANREPYIHNHGPNGIELQRPASGLVSAMEPIMRACGGTWIAHGSGTADRETVDANDRIRVPPNAPEYTLKRVWISEAEQDGYYYGLANEGLWPLCHIAFTRPVFRADDWAAYRAINERFAANIVAEVKTSNPIVLVQDYHFALLPRMLRDRLPGATIITFWHIPWPNSETFGIFPWKAEIIQGLLGSTIIGFHTQFHCNNFLETVDRFVESRIDREQESVTLKGQETFVRPYPISIDWPPAALADQKPITECRRSVRERLGLSADCRIAVGIERFDYTKGVLDRMTAVDRMLEAHPEWIGKFSLVQAAAPTRSKLPMYRALQEEAVRVADKINAKYEAAAHQPITLIIRHHEPGEVFELFRAADACIVSSLHDGMNLVAKEFIAARDDERGVLLLSSFAGASRELSESIIINPYDAQSMGESLHQALTMPAQEQHERMRLMRDQVRSRNVYRWAGQMLLDASSIRKKQRILEIASGR
ncbi:MAG: trehalose-6-phosphate synthase [Hyphomicrobium sp.]